MADGALTEQVFQLQQAVLSSATKKQVSRDTISFCKKYHIIPSPPSSRWNILPYNPPVSVKQARDIEIVHNTIKLYLKQSKLE